jgi:YD repeat-containing protein
MINQRAGIVWQYGYDANGFISGITVNAVTPTAPA